MMGKINDNIYHWSSMLYIDYGRDIHTTGHWQDHPTVWPLDIVTELGKTCEAIAQLFRESSICEGLLPQRSYQHYNEAFYDFISQIQSGHGPLTAIRRWIDEALSFEFEACNPWLVSGTVMC
ncbi:hypothetical protein BDY19DRAFT_241371 [Irpex rosettiformis]|uniref:Uncharacterized protein n=1 Tax=Irpex rosettiformis TaxID=378272 RepID=A0ACB8U0P7_9APHY|nr:hypothetical protein BDY19DRAFT_241371 [Irpex rosettiformis]